MDLTLVTSNLLNAPVLFFMLGALASWVKSDLEIPAPIAKLLSLYLLTSIGYRGGMELAENGVSPGVARMLGLCMLLAMLTPVWCFFIVKRRTDASNAAAIAATYGSISAVTFITAASFLNQRGVEYGGYMVAAMALMESPSIVVAIMLARMHSTSDAAGASGMSLRKVLHEAFLNGAVLVLLGSLAIGALTHNDSKALMPFMKDPFKGVLCLFLLDMGLVAARRMGDLRQSGAFFVSFAIVAAPIHAMLGIVLAKAIGAAPGDALLLAVLSGSASYIAVPAAVRLSLPQASPGLFVPMSLALTFPFNVVVGIPMYMSIIDWWWS